MINHIQMAADTRVKKKLGLFEGGLFGTGFGYGHPVSAYLDELDS